MVVCVLCQVAPAAVFCYNDNAHLCVACDAQIHNRHTIANKLTWQGGRSYENGRAHTTHRQGGRSSPRLVVEYSYSGPPCERVPSGRVMGCGGSSTHGLSPSCY